MDHTLWAAWFVLYFVMRIAMFAAADMKKVHVAHQIRRARGGTLVAFGIVAVLLGGSPWWLLNIPLGLVLALASDATMETYINTYMGVVPVTRRGFGKTKLKRFDHNIDDHPPVL